MNTSRLIVLAALAAFSLWGCANAREERNQLITIETARIEGDQDAYMQKFYDCLDDKVPPRPTALEDRAPLADAAVDACSDIANVLAALAGDKALLAADAADAVDAADPKAMNDSFSRSGKLRAVAYRDTLAQGRAYFLERVAARARK